MNCNGPSRPGLVETTPGTRRNDGASARGLFVRRNHRTTGGFTLLELLIVIALISVIMAMSIVTGTSSSDRRKFQYAVDRLETTLRMARAEAVNKAHRIRLSFDEETRLPTLLWEPAPLTEPEQFQPYTACSWLSRLPTDRIAVTKCRMIGLDGKPLDETPTSVGGDETDNEEMQSITFNQDGSSDSVLIEIEATDPGVSLRAAIKLDGENNIITTKILYAPTEDDEEDPFAEDETEIAE